MRQCHKSLSNHTTIITAQSTVEFYIWSLKMVHNSHLLHLCFVLYDTATFDEFAVHTDFLNVHIFWGGHKILRNLHCTVDLSYVVPVKCKVEISQKFCDLLRIYELYRLKSSGRTNPKTSVQFFKVVFLSSSKNTEEDFHFLNLLLIYFYCRSLSLIGFDAPF